MLFKESFLSGPNTLTNSDVETIHHAEGEQNHQHGYPLRQTGGSKKHNDDLWAFALQHDHL